MSDELTPKQCLKKLAKGNIEPLYYIWGEEDFLGDQVLAALKQKVLEGGSSDFNYDRFDAATTAVETILDAVRTLPFMSRRRLVVVEHIEALANAGAFKEYCQAPYDETCLVFSARAAAKKGVHDMLRRTAVGVVCKRLKGKTLASWVANEAGLLRLKLRPEAAAILIDFVGNELRALRSELVKLQLFAGGDAEIDIAEVVKLVGDNRAVNVFELTDAAGEGRLDDALRMLSKLLQGRQSAPGIVAMLARHFRLLWRARTLQKQRIAPTALAGKLGVPPFLARRYAEQAQRYSETRLRRHLLQLYAADQALKMSGLPDNLTLEKLLLEFMLTGQGDAGGAAQAAGPRAVGHE